MQERDWALFTPSPYNLQLNYINVTDCSSIYNNYAKCEHDEYDEYKYKI